MYVYIYIYIIYITIILQKKKCIYAHVYFDVREQKKGWLLECGGVVWGGAQVGYNDFVTSGSLSTAKEKGLVSMPHRNRFS